MAPVLKMHPHSQLMALTTYGSISRATRRHAAIDLGQHILGVYVVVCKQGRVWLQGRAHVRQMQRTGSQVSRWQDVAAEGQAPPTPSTLAASSLGT